MFSPLLSSPVSSRRSRVTIEQEFWGTIVALFSVVKAYRKLANTLTRLFTGDAAAIYGYYTPKFARRTTSRRCRSWGCTPANRCHYPELFGIILGDRCSERENAQSRDGKLI